MQVTGDYLENRLILYRSLELKCPELLSGSSLYMGWPMAIDVRTESPDNHPALQYPS